MRKFRGQVRSWKKLERGPSLRGRGRQLLSAGRLPGYPVRTLAHPDLWGSHSPLPHLSLGGLSLFRFQFT